MGWAGSWDGQVELPAMEERLEDEFAFVRKVLPDEHPGLAVVALIAIRQQGRRPTRDTIRARLVDSGRSIEQLREKGWTE